MQTSSTLNFFLLSFICTSWASNFDIINMLSCFHAIPAVQFNTRVYLDVNAPSSIIRRVDTR